MSAAWFRARSECSAETWPRPPPWPRGRAGAGVRLRGQTEDLHSGELPEIRPANNQRLVITHGVYIWFLDSPIKICRSHICDYRCGYQRHPQGVGPRLQHHSQCIFQREVARPAPPGQQSRPAQGLLQTDGWNKFQLLRRKYYFRTLPSKYLRMTGLT